MEKRRQCWSWRTGERVANEIAGCLCLPDTKNYIVFADTLQVRCVHRHSSPVPYTSFSDALQSQPKIICTGSVLSLLETEFSCLV